MIFLATGIKKPKLRSMVRTLGVADDADVGYIFAVVVFGFVLPLLGCLLVCALRVRARRRYNVQGCLAEDCLAAVACPCLVVNQLARHEGFGEPGMPYRLFSADGQKAGTRVAADVV